jgi:serine/threonine-protein kinase
MTRSAVRYLLGEQLGEGGMAKVFHATATGAEGFVRPVVIKRILPALSTSPDFTYLFVREARLAAKLAHPNVVSVLDFDRDDEGRLFLVMELVQGMDLARLMASGPLPESVVVFLVCEILSGLGYAHSQPAGGIVHRDVSPPNVLVSWEGAVKISDFGLAWECDDDSTRLPFEGKPAYMSPEQVTRGRLDGRSDLFSVGVVLWEILTGERLFRHRDRQTMIDRVLYHRIPRPSSVRPVSPDLGAIAMRLLARDPASRYSTADKAIEALTACRAASLRGRSELVRLLAGRFPHRALPTQVYDARQRRTPLTPTMPDRLVPAPLLWRAPRWAVRAASESEPRA